MRILRGIDICLICFLLDEKKKKPSEKPVGRKSHEIRFATLRGHGDSGCEQLKVAGSHFDPTENGVGFSLGEKMGFVFFLVFRVFKMILL